MGQKVSPIGLRLGINKDWEAKWYANNSEFSDYLQKSIPIVKKSYHIPLLFATGWGVPL